MFVLLLINYSKMRNNPNPFDDILDKLADLHTKQEQLNDIISHKEKTASDLLTPDEAAKLLGKAKQTLYEYCSQGKIPYFKKFGGSYFSKKQLIAWAKENGYNQHLVDPSLQ